jgi:hypothetical protein
MSSLSELVGAHPNALRLFYEAGRVADPAVFGASPRGRILALEAGQDIFLVLRRLFQIADTDRSPWQGKVFEPSGSAGQNVVFGRRTASFRVEHADSVIDGKPTLLLRYDDPADKNPWPIRAIRDELRSVGQGLAIGPFLFVQGPTSRVVGWWGLERR